MKRTCKSEWFVLDKPLEDDVVFNEDSYSIERREENNTVIWFGIKTNWKKEGSKSWEKLVKGEFVNSEEPIYEKLLKTF